MRRAAGPRWRAVLVLWSAMLHSAAVLVPSAGRGEWLAEWRAELWHLCGPDDGARRPGRWEITGFCVGAYRDALALRAQAARSGIGPRLVRRGRVAAQAGVGRSLQPGGPVRSLAVLGMLLGVALGLCLAVPGARDMWSRAGAQPAETVALLSREGHVSLGGPSIAFGQYAAWKTGGLAAFRGLVFLQVRRVRVEATDEPARVLRVGYASTALAALMPQLADGSGQAAPEQPYALLTPGAAAWELPAGHRHGKVRIAGRPVPVAGVAGAPWPLPDAVDLVVLAPDAELARVVAGASGFVLAPRVGSAVHREDAARPYLLVREPASEAVERYECGSLQQRRENPVVLFVTALVLACLALPATTPLPLADAEEMPASLPVRIRARRWGLLAARVGLLVPAAFFGSLWAAAVLAAAGSAEWVYVQAAVAFAALLFGFRWAVQDGRRRCPACLRLLSHPAVVGHASRSFLAWSGTEMLCQNGHGFLYIPEHRTSWSSAQRWLPAHPV